MKYIINNKVFFDTDAAMLSPQGISDETIQISNPASRLLQLLISHQGETLSRDVIFARVWDDFGMISSNNNLNQCVSKIRRVLRNLGIADEAIITIPKIGFMLQQSISIEIVPDRLVALPQCVNNTATNPMLNPARPGRKKTASSYWLWPCLAVAALMVILLWPGAESDSYIGTVGTCNILLAEKRLNDGNNAKIITEIIAHSQQLQPQCSENEYLLVTKNAPAAGLFAYRHRLYFMLCQRAQGSPAEFCRSLQ